MILRFRAIAIGALLSGILAPVTASAAASDFTPDEFVAAFDSALLLGLGPIGPAPPITGNAGIDEDIRVIAEERGYTRRPGPDRPLAGVDGLLRQPEAAEAWHSMRDRAARDGISMSLTSAYRDAARQTELFRNRLLGSSDAAIRAALSRLAAPGYSRHQTGYAIDLGSEGKGSEGKGSEGKGSEGKVFEGKVFDGFADTAAFRWLSEDNYANAKAFGWIPSYPTGSDSAGPDPEPWELVWIGATNIACARFAPTASQPFCDTSGSAASFADHNFIDVAPESFATAAISWAAADGITQGTTPTTFAPGAVATRGQTAAFLYRFDRPAGIS